MLVMVIRISILVSVSIRGTIHIALTMSTVRAVPIDDSGVDKRNDIEEVDRETEEECGAQLRELAAVATRVGGCCSLNNMDNGNDSDYYIDSDYDIDSDYGIGSDDDIDSDYYMLAFFVAGMRAGAAEGSCELAAQEGQGSPGSYSRRRKKSGSCQVGCVVY